MCFKDYFANIYKKITNSKFFSKTKKKNGAPFLN